MDALDFTPDQELAQRIRVALPRAGEAGAEGKAAREVALRLWASLQQERFHDEKRVDVDVADLLELIAYVERTT